MTRGDYTVLTPGPAWTATRQRLAQCGLDDIYFDDRYLSLYAGEDGEPVGFLFERGNAVFFLPILKKRIPKVAGDDCYDLETAYGYGGPVATSTAPDFLAAAWRAFSAYCAEARIVAGFFRFHPLLETQRFAAEGPVSATFDRETVFIDLDQNEAAVWEGYSANNRNRIRKAIKNDLQVIQCEDSKALRIFADLYREHMKEIGAEKAYLFDDAYFDGIAAMGPKRFRVYLVDLNGETLGGALVLLADRFIHYHLSSSLRSSFGLAPNNMLRHAAITNALGGGWDRFHFGGGRSSDPNDSLLKFKKGFSKRTARYYTGTLIADGARYDTLRADWARRHPNLTRPYGDRVLCYRHT